LKVPKLADGAEIERPLRERRLQIGVLIGCLVASKKVAARSPTRPNHTVVAFARRKRLLSVEPPRSATMIVTTRLRKAKKIFT